MKEYYDTRAPEYDEWYLGVGRFHDRERPGWNEELADLITAIEALAPKPTRRGLRLERILNDGSRWPVYKRYFTSEQLAHELGGGEHVFAGQWFVVVRA